MSDADLIRLAIMMRLAQRVYMETRKPDDLKQARALADRFDSAVKNWGNEP